MMRKPGCLTLTLMFLAGAAAVSRAGEDDPTPLRVNIGVDGRTHHFFRGFLQEDQGLIVQPWIDTGIPLGENSLGIWELNVGLWNSLHNGPTGLEGAATTGPDAWYESDFYFGLGVRSENVAASATYLIASSPNNSFNTKQEVSFSVVYNDAEWWGEDDDSFTGLQPHAILAFEIDNQTDGGSDKGIYLELGIEPGFTLNESGDLPVFVALPVTFGFSVSDYYQPAGRSDDSLGFIQTGASASIPLTMVPERFGAWTLTGSVEALFLGDNTERINNGDGSEIVGTIGVGISF